jgi:hypothetical protein
VARDVAKRLADRAAQRLRGPDRVEGQRLLGLAPILDVALLDVVQVLVDGIV